MKRKIITVAVILVMFFVGFAAMHLFSLWMCASIDLRPTSEIFIGDTIIGVAFAALTGYVSDIVD